MEMKVLISSLPARAEYANRLKIECGECGKCCEEFVGVRVWPDEISDMATLMKMDEATFRGMFTSETGNHVVFLKQPCPFHKENKCQIYEIRPRNCRIFPARGITVNGKTVLGVSDFCPKADEALTILEGEVKNEQLRNS